MSVTPKTPAAFDFDAWLGDADMQRETVTVKARGRDYEITVRQAELDELEQMQKDARDSEVTQTRLWARQLAVQAVEPKLTEEQAYRLLNAFGLDAATNLIGQITPVAYGKVVTPDFSGEPSAATEGD